MRQATRTAAVLAWLVGLALGGAPLGAAVESKRGDISVTSVASPDRTVTVELLEQRRLSYDAPPAQSLWVVDGRTGQRRRLLVSRSDPDPERTLTELGTPVFSPDGGYVYLTAGDAWATSGAVHQVSVRTGAERFVVAGDLIAVIRTGPYRGDLLVQQHRYHHPSVGGSYNPVYVVRPDGRELFAVPGSENDDGGYAVVPWLRKKGWVAN